MNESITISWQIVVPNTKTGRLIHDGYSILSLTGQNDAFLKK